MFRLTQQLKIEYFLKYKICINSLRIFCSEFWSHLPTSPSPSLPRSTPPFLHHFQLHAVLKKSNPLSLLCPDHILMAVSSSPGSYPIYHMLPSFKKIDSPPPQKSQHLWNNALKARHSGYPKGLSVKLGLLHYQRNLTEINDSERVFKC